VSTDACAWTCSAQARASVAPTGLRFWGIAEEPPASRSRTSPNADSSATSVPIFPSTPAATSSEAPRRPTGTRFACHGSTGSASPSSPAYSRAISGPASPSAANVPAAPPSWAIGSNARTSARASSTAVSQLAARRPNVVGTAGWRSVRATATVRRCSRASAAHPAATPSSSARITFTASRATSIAAVSTMSWLVAP
jgi:hypothetical protein